MKIRDLLNIEKAIATKNKELEEKKHELERLRQEAEKLKLIVDINNRQYTEDELINVNNIYIFISKAKGNRVRFVEKRKTKRVFYYDFVDIYTKEFIGTFNSGEIYDIKTGNDHLYFCNELKDAFPETLIYLDGMVPRLLLQKLYYQANGIDEKILKLGTMKDYIIS